MHRILITIRKRPGVSRDQFIRYYEEEHTRLLATLMPATATLYRRNYIVWDDPAALLVNPDRRTLDRGDDNAFDCITELERPTREALEAGLRRLFEDETFRKVKADEDAFIAADGVRFYFVEVRP